MKPKPKIKANPKKVFRHKINVPPFWDTLRVPRRPLMIRFRLSLWRSVIDHALKDVSAGDQPAPSDQPISNDQPTPSDQPSSSDQATPSDQPRPSDQPTPNDQRTPSDQPTPSDLASPSDQPVASDPARLKNKAKHSKAMTMPYRMLSASSLHPKISPRPATQHRKAMTIPYHMLSRCAFHSKIS